MSTNHHEIPDTPPPAPTSGGASARSRLFTRLHAVAVAANDDPSGRIASTPFKDSDYTVRWAWSAVPTPANDNGVIGPEPLPAGDLERLAKAFPNAATVAPALYRGLSVLCVDQAGFSLCVLKLNNRIGPAGVLACTLTIRAVLADALRRTGLPEGSLIKMTGDGAFLICAAEDALRLGRAILDGFDRHNAGTGSLDGEVDLRIDVRVGIASGPLAWADGEFGGLPLVVASRLQAGTPRAGWLSIDEATWAATSADERIGMVGPWTMKGKRRERFMAFTTRHRALSNTSAPHRNPGVLGWLLRRVPRD